VPLVLLALDEAPLLLVVLVVSPLQPPRPQEMLRTEKPTMVLRMVLCLNDSITYLHRHLNTKEAVW